MPSPSLAALAGFDQKVVVGVGDFAVSNNQTVVLTTYSLGSCIGVTLYDPVVRVGGLLHFMLPDSSTNPAKAAEQPAMFADTGIPALFRAAYQMRAEKHRAQICLAGGAQVMDSSGFFNIGARNYEGVATLLREHGLRIQAEQVGGMVSRTVMLNVRTGEVRLKVSGQAAEFVLCQGG
ncbi:MAG: chemotaxis protein CheD [Verrucomicrobiota bacterium]